MTTEKLRWLPDIQAVGEIIQEYVGGGAPLSIADGSGAYAGLEGEAVPVLTAISLVRAAY